LPWLFLPTPKHHVHYDGGGDTFEITLEGFLNHNRAILGTVK
jgi:hypothetical protein